MKFRQVFFTVVISAITTFGVMWGYNKIEKNNHTYGGQETGVVPSNYKYAGLFDNNTPPGAIDFTQPAAAALPAVVHIKTKISARTVSNGSTRRSNPFADLFGDDDMFGDFFGNRGGTQVIPEQRASGIGQAYGIFQPALRVRHFACGGNHVDSSNYRLCLIERC